MTDHPRPHLDPAAALAANAEARDSLTPRQRSVGTLSAGFAARDTARARSVTTAATPEADALRAQADALQAVTGRPNSASAAVRLAAAYSGSVERADQAREQRVADQDAQARREAAAVRLAERTAHH